MKTFQKIRTFHEYKKMEELSDRTGRGFPVYEIGDEVVITEKIDGANAQIINHNGKLTSFSHHKELTPDNTLRGFYGFVNDHEEFKNIPEGYAVFGEWLVPHTIKYKTDAYKSFFVFDVFDFEAKSYLGYDKTKEFFKKYLSGIQGVNMIPFLDRRKDVDSADIEKLQKEYADKSKLSEDGLMEGIVLSDMDKIMQIGSDSKGPLRTKSVNTAFKEIAKSKIPLTDDERKLMAWLESYLTDPRVRKQYFSLLESGSIPATMSFEWFQNGVAKLIGEKLLEDAIEESPELPALLQESSPSKEKYMNRARKFANKVANRFIALTIKGLI